MTDERLLPEPLRFTLPVIVILAVLWNLWSAATRGEVIAFAPRRFVTVIRHEDPTRF